MPLKVHRTLRIFCCVPILRLVFCEGVFRVTLDSRARSFIMLSSPYRTVVDVHSQLLRYLIIYIHRKYHFHEHCSSRIILSKFTQLYWWLIQYETFCEDLDASGVLFFRNSVRLLNDLRNDSNTRTFCSFLTLLREIDAKVIGKGKRRRRESRNLSDRVQGNEKSTEKRQVQRSELAMVVCRFRCQIRLLQKVLAGCTPPAVRQINWSIHQWLNY